MKLSEVVDTLELRVRCGSDRLDRQIRGGYASDLLSDVMANTRAGDLWVTLQIHLNIVAVATLNDLAGIVLVNGREPEEATVKKAEQEGVPLMITPLPAFEVVGRLYQLGVRAGEVSP